jgi:spoIIIJ-associated protein
MNLVEVKGKTIEEAIDRALKKLGLAKKDVEVEIVTTGKTGFLGLGAEDAVVRVTAKEGATPRKRRTDNYNKNRNPVNQNNHSSYIKLPIKINGQPDDLPESVTEDFEDRIDLAGKTIRDILNYLGFPDTSIKSSIPQNEAEGLGRIESSFNITPNTRDYKKELGILIGKSGYTIRSFQTIVNAIVSQKSKENTYFNIDIDSYKIRKTEALSEMALDIADEIRMTKETVVLEPMPPYERRIIHLTIEKEEGVASKSSGKGSERKVEIYYNDNN